jgi:hypothetical protein
MCLDGDLTDAEFKLNGRDLHSTHEARIRHCFDRGFAAMNYGAWKSTVALTGLVLITNDLGASAQVGSMTTAGRGAPLAISASTIRVLHRTVTINGAFEPFTNALEKILGRFPEGVQQDILAQPQRAKERFKAAEDAQELMIFLVFDHGAALNMVGARRNAKQYLIGNPLTAIR